MVEQKKIITFALSIGRNPFVKSIELQEVWILKSPKFSYEDRNVTHALTSWYMLCT